MILSLEILKVGECTFADFLFRKGGRFRMRHFPAQVALIKCSTEGWMLFDTGYSRYFGEVCATFPEKLYQFTTPVHLPEEEQLVKQLANRGVSVDQIKKIYLSHFHADHVAGLRDFPDAEIVFSREAHEPYLNMKRFDQVKYGFLAGLLPDDLSERSQVQDAVTLDDLCNEPAVQLVQLAGHSMGHCGLLVRVAKQEVLLVGDAIWTMDEFNQEIELRPLAERVIWDKQKYRQTQRAIRAWLSVAPNRQIVVSHELSNLKIAQDISL